MRRQLLWQLLLFTIGLTIADLYPNLTALDCGMRRILYERALKLQPWRGKQKDTFDSLRLTELCGDDPPPYETRTPPSFPINDSSVDVESIFFVHPNLGNDINDGTSSSPFRSVHRALTASRKTFLHHTKRKIVLQEGVHFLNETIVLTAADSGTIITNAPGADAWLSGGKLLPKDLKWEKSENKNIWVADLKSLGIDDVPGLFTLNPHRRLIRARFPNADPETAQWGYASTGRYNWSIPAASVNEWWKPPSGKVPSMRYVDLSQPGNPSGYIKDDSTMPAYNTWGNGRGGVCNDMWTGPSYWCGNASSGGWAEVDKECALAGRLQLPVGMTINRTYQKNMTQPLGPMFDQWMNTSGAVVHAWHSQSWAMHMFEVSGHDASAGTLTFSSGGQQGGRNWCRCDQCSYAGKWCGQHENPPNKSDTRLISGSWFVENIREELDVPGEFFFNRSTGKLYLFPNNTASPQGIEFTVPVLQSLVRIEGSQQAPVKDVVIQGIGLRDAAATFMGEWGAPSGGDWSLHRGGAIFIEGAENVTVSACTFWRLDGNALFLSRYTRNILISKNEFGWIGDGAMATWGDTEDYDARGGAQPRHTMVTHNYVHELGIYEKQSSAWGQAKACQSTLVNNIFFNMPRAAINFNDGLGGGNNISGNLIWNTCRESGDHGPINSWDRMPFLTNLLGHPSFSSLPNQIENNLIISNYGGSQGLDNDDGSSWYHIHNNVFYCADGFKMDYGGHDSRFYQNLIISVPYDGQNCINVASFKKGHGHKFFNNTCVSGVDRWGWSSGTGAPIDVTHTRKGPDMDHIGHISQCDPSIVEVHSNRYYTPNGNASMTCNGKNTLIPEVQTKYKIETDSTWAKLPRSENVLMWARTIINRW